MKKQLIILALLFCTIAANSQILKQRATSFAFKINEPSGNWGDWTDWKESTVLLVFDLDDNTLTIQSKDYQQYKMGELIENTSDDKGAVIKKFEAIDEDKIRCIVKFRRQKDGTEQVYIQFSDFMIAYNLNSEFEK